MKNITIILLSACVGALLNMALMKSCQEERTSNITEIKTDTLTTTKVDTNKIVLPHPIKINRVFEFEVPEFTKYVFIDNIITDTVILGGQTFYQEIKTYQDSTFKAQISGINAYLDWIEVYPKTVTQTIHSEKIIKDINKWNIYAGANVSVYGDKTFFPIAATLEYTNDKTTYEVDIGYEIINKTHYYGFTIKRTILSW